MPKEKDTVIKNVSIRISPDELKKDPEAVLLTRVADIIYRMDEDTDKKELKAEVGQVFREYLQAKDGKDILIRRELELEKADYRDSESGHSGIRAVDQWARLIDIFTSNGPAGILEGVLYMFTGIDIPQILAKERNEAAIAEAKQEEIDKRTADRPYLDTLKENMVDTYKAQTKRLENGEITVGDFEKFTKSQARTLFNAEIFYENKDIRNKMAAVCRIGSDFGVSKEAIESVRDLYNIAPMDKEKWQVFQHNADFNYDELILAAEEDPFEDEPMDDPVDAPMPDYPTDDFPEDEPVDEKPPDDPTDKPEDADPTDKDSDVPAPEDVDHSAKDPAANESPAADPSDTVGKDTPESNVQEKEPEDMDAPADQGGSDPIGDDSPEDTPVSQNLDGDEEWKRKNTPYGIGTDAGVGAADIPEEQTPEAETESALEADPDPLTVPHEEMDLDGTEPAESQAGAEGPDETEAIDSDPADAEDAAAEDLDAADADSVTEQPQHPSDPVNEIDAEDLYATEFGDVSGEDLEFSPNTELFEYKGTLQFLVARDPDSPDEFTVMVRDAITGEPEEIDDGDVVELMKGLMDIAGNLELSPEPGVEIIDMNDVAMDSDPFDSGMESGNGMDGGFEHADAGTPEVVYEDTADPFVVYDDSANNTDGGLYPQDVGAVENSQIPLQPFETNPVDTSDYWNQYDPVGYDG